MKRETLTPMMQQYMDIKENTSDALVFYRLGDFYELFFEDAIVASKALDLVLTARSAGKDNKAPMCGVPYHAARSYIQKLISQGFKVAIVEQVEDPKEAKGIVRREVVEVITPGTYIDQDEESIREIAAVHFDLVYATFVMCNLSDGVIRSIRVINQESEIVKVIRQYSILELVVSENDSVDTIQRIKDKTGIVVSYENELDIAMKHTDHAIEQALQRLHYYLTETQKRTLIHLSDVIVLNDESFMRMDYVSMRNLELLNHETDRALSLYAFLNRTQTTMGARLLREDLMQPLVSIERIETRQNQIGTLIDNQVLSMELRSLLKDAYDIQRVIARISTGKSNAQDLVRLKKTLAIYHQVQKQLINVDKFEFIANLPAMDACFGALDNAIYDDAPVQLKEGRTFKPGINEELDSLISITKDGKKWLLEYEAEQREITGIKNLKVGYTRAFGYYIEITRGQMQNVKDSFGFIRKQTLTNAERYISEELQEYEMKILKASDRILEIEETLLKSYTEYVAGFAIDIHAIGDALARLDVLLAYSEVSSLPGYVKPKFAQTGDVNIIAGRHPVLESQLGNQNYVASDVTFDVSRQLQILTGPNMGGKSTYMRMVALNIVLAQMGCYVPAQSCDLGVVDQIFTRMGASDDILMGQSTFMIEMIEAQHALANATTQSLVLFDEIGRGTATYDGMALAQAIVEYLVHTVKCKTIFSTHYHELVALESVFEGISNIHVDVHEEDDHVTFLYQVIDGGADKSYGINVARLAHLPNRVLEQAKINLEALEAQRGNVDLQRKVVVVEKTSEAYRKVKAMLERVDVDKMTPLEALLLLSDIKSEMRDDDV